MFSDNELNKKLLGKEPFVKDVELKTTITFLDKNGEEHKVDTTITRDSVHTMVSPYRKKYGEDINKDKVEMVLFNISDLISGLKDYVSWYEDKVKVDFDDKHLPL